MSSFSNQSISSLRRTTIKNNDISINNDDVQPHVGSYNGKILSCKPKEQFEVKRTVGWDCEPICKPKCPPPCPPPCEPKCEQPCEQPCEQICQDPCDNRAGYGGCGYWLWYLVWFFIIAIIVWFILYALKPDFIQTTNDRGEYTGEVDQGKLLFSAIIIAIVILIIIWIIMWACGGRRYC